MATTTISVTSFQLALAECADAIDAENWRSARLKAAKAEAILCGLEESLTDSGGANVKRRSNLNALNEQISSAKAEVSETDNANTTFVDLENYRD